MEYFYQNWNYWGLAVVFALNMALCWLVFDLRKKWNSVFGKKIGNQDDLLKNVVSGLTQIGTRLETVESKTKFLESISKISVQKIGFKRYNPFTETGGDQSFTLVLLDQNLNGVIISSLYLREGVRVYGKLVESGKPKQQLSEEEKGVLEETLRKGIANRV